MNTNLDRLLTRGLISFYNVLILGLILFLAFRNYAIGEVSSRRRWLQPILLLLSISGGFIVLVLMLAYFVDGWKITFAATN